MRDGRNLFWKEKHAHSERWIRTGLFGYEWNRPAFCSMQISRIQNMPEFLRQGLRYWLLGRPSGHSFELYRVSGSLFHGIVLFCLFHCELFLSPSSWSSFQTSPLDWSFPLSNIRIQSRVWNGSIISSLYLFTFVYVIPWLCLVWGAIHGITSAVWKKDNVLRNVDLLGCSGCVFGQAMHEREQRQDDRQLLDHLYDRSCMVSDPERAIS